MSCWPSRSSASLASGSAAATCVRSTISRAPRCRQPWCSAANCWRRWPARQPIAHTGLAIQLVQVLISSRSAGSFFPAARRGGLGQAGAATSSTTTASGGRLVVDTRLGMSLGHTVCLPRSASLSKINRFVQQPSSSLDSLSGAIAGTMKVYRQALQSGKGESEAKRIERLRTLGVRVFVRLTDELHAVAWPTATAFSLEVCFGKFSQTRAPSPLCADQTMGPCPG